jgi:hypothetical protein
MSSGSPAGDADQPFQVELTRCVAALVAAAKRQGLLPTDECEHKLGRNLVAALLFSRKTNPPRTTRRRELIALLLARAVRFLGLGITPPQVPPPPAVPTGRSQHGEYSVAVLSCPLTSRGGDVLRVGHGGGRLWALVGDVSGHGMAANAVVAVVEWVWDTVLAALPADATPAAAADEVERRLAPHLPECVFVEAAVVRADDTGLDVLAAGGVRTVVAASATAPAKTRTLSGHWFGHPTLFGMPADRDVARIDLTPGGQALFGTDGLFEHPLADGTVLADRLPAAWAVSAPPCLHEAVVDGFTRSTHARHDDAAALAFRRT